ALGRDAPPGPVPDRAPPPPACLSSPPGALTAPPPARRPGPPDTSRPGHRLTATHPRGGTYRQDDGGETAAEQHEPTDQRDRRGDAEPGQGGSGVDTRVHARPAVGSHDHHDVAPRLGLQVEPDRPGSRGGG